MYFAAHFITKQFTLIITLLHFFFFANHVINISRWLGLPAVLRERKLPVFLHLNPTEPRTSNLSINSGYCLPRTEEGNRRTQAHVGEFIGTARTILRKWSCTEFICDKRNNYLPRRPLRSPISTSVQWWWLRKVLISNGGVYLYEQRGGWLYGEVVTSYHSRGVLEVPEEGSPSWSARVGSL